jgi:hypothetical protein
VSVQVLFIGGVMDGQWGRLDPHHFWLPYRAPRPILPTPSGSVERNELLVDEYDLECIRGCDQDFLLYRLSSLTVDEMMRKLLQGYRPDKGVNCATE